MSNNNQKFNLTVAPMYTNDNGNLTSIPVTPSMFDAIQEIKVGGKFFLKANKAKTHDKSPDFYLEYMSPEKLASFKNEQNKARASGARNNDSL